MNHVAASEIARVRQVLPKTVQEFVVEWPRFKAWLKSNGSEILPTCNNYEIARFATGFSIGAVFCSPAQVIHRGDWQGTAMPAFLAFRNNDPNWKQPRTVGKLPVGTRWLFKESIGQRDGWKCCYCPRLLKVSTATLEHFVPRSLGGPNVLANMGLACERCNSAVGAMTVVEKLRYAQSFGGTTREMLERADDAAGARLWNFVETRSAAP